MTGETIIFQDDGSVVAQVINRQEHMCSEIYRITNNMGTLVSDEELPDCSPTQHEITGQ